MSTVSSIQSGSLGKTLMRYMIPSTMSVWVFAAYIMVDGMFVGKFVGPEALAAVNLSLPLAGGLFALSIMFSIGAATMVGMSKGRGEVEHANRLFSCVFFFMLLLGAGIYLATRPHLEIIAWALGARGELIGLVVSYISILLMFNVFYMSTYTLELFTKVDGRPKKQLIAVLTAAFTNIALDYVFIVKMGMGLEGAALATGTAQVVGFFLLVSDYIFAKSTLKLRLMIPNPKWILDFARIGFPDSITEFSVGLSLLLFNSVIMYHFNSDYISAFSVTGYVWNLAVLTSVGLTQGMQPIASYLKGKGDHASLNKVVNYSRGVAIVVGVIFYLLSYHFDRQIASLYLNDADMVELAADLLSMFSVGFIFSGLNVVGIGYYTAIDSPKVAGTLSILRGALLPFVILYLTPKLFSVNSIWYAGVTTEFMVFVIVCFLAKKESIAHKRQLVAAT